MHYFVINFLLLVSASIMAMSGDPLENARAHSKRSCVIAGRTGLYTITFPEGKVYAGPISTDLADIIATIAQGDWQALHNVERLKALEYNELEIVQCYCGHRQNAVEVAADLWSNAYIEESVIALQIRLSIMPEDKVTSNEFPAFPDMNQIQSFVPRVDRVKMAQQRKWQASGEWNDDCESALSIFDRLHGSPAAPYIATIMQTLGEKNDDDAAAYLMQETYAAAATVELLDTIKNEEWIQRHYGCRYEAPIRRSALSVEDTGIQIKEDADRIYFFSGLPHRTAEEDMLLQQLLIDAEPIETPQIPYYSDDMEK